jgi:hypothetical protein
LTRCAWAKRIAGVMSTARARTTRILKWRTTKDESGSG